MADLLKLDWHGRSIKRRAADDWFDLTDIVQASNAHTGNRARLTKWLGNEDTQRFLRSLSKDTGIPVSLNDARESPLEGLLNEGEKAQKRDFSALIEQRGKGAHIWGHKTAALRLCAWLDTDLEVKIYQWVEQQAERSRRPRPLDAASAQVVADRRAANRSLSAVAHDRSVPPFMVHDAKVQGLTGKQPRHWTAELGTERWQETAPIGHQALQMMASQAAANSCQSLDPDASTKRHYIAAAKEAGSDLRSYAEKYGLPYQPTYEGPAFGADRVKRVLEQSNDVPLLDQST